MSNAKAKSVMAFLRKAAIFLVFVPVIASCGTDGTENELMRGSVTDTVVESHLSGSALETIGGQPAPPPSLSFSPHSGGAVTTPPVTPQTSQAESSSAGAPGVAMTFTARANKRYISLQGSDAGDGLTPQTAWRRLQPNVGKIPPDTEVIFMDGVYEFESSVYFSTAEPTPLPRDVTLRAQSYRGATLRGSATPLKNVNASGIAFVFMGKDVRTEIWGFMIENWKGDNAGAILVGYDVDGLRISENHFRGNGSTRFDHIVYLSGGETFETTQRNWIIEDNFVELAPGSGAFINIRAGAYGARDGIVRRNKVRGAGYWGIVQNDVRQSETSSNIQVYENDFSAKFSQAVMQFANYNTPGHLNGVDSTFVVERNRFENLDPEGFVLWRYPEIPGEWAQHAPTLRNNQYWNLSGKVLSGFQRGAGDSINGQ